MEQGRNRLTKRRAIHWPTTLHEGDQRQACTIIDVSRGGAKLRLTRPVTAKNRIALVDDRVGMLEAMVMWVRGDLAGIAFLADTPRESLAKLRQVINALEVAEARQGAARRTPTQHFGRRAHHGAVRK